MLTQSLEGHKGPRHGTGQMTALLQHHVIELLDLLNLFALFAQHQCARKTTSVCRSVTMQEKHSHHIAIYALHKQEQQPLCAGAYLPMPTITASIATNGKTITASCTCNAALENHSDLPTRLLILMRH